MSQRVLIAEDDEPLGILLASQLEADGFEIESVTDGGDAELRIHAHVPDLLLVSWALRGITGVELCRRLRARSETKSLPIIMFTARGKKDDRLRTSNIGADDYITKPFPSTELLARIRALLRRAKPGRNSNILELGDLILNRETLKAHRGGRELRMGPAEFNLLEFLMSNPGKVYTRKQLVDRIRGPETLDERTIDVHVGRLRGSLNRGRDQDPIRTVRGIGYSFDEMYGLEPCKLTTARFRRRRAPGSGKNRIRS